MDNNLFTQLCKYKPTDKLTPLENFVTESFVYILKQLLDEDNLTANKILNLFSITDQISSNNICSQKVFHCVYNNNFSRLRPDIYIETNDEQKCIIEVKIDSPVGKSKLELFDQLDDYTKLIPKQNVFSLTKKYCSSKSIDEKNKKYWNEITFILKQSSNSLAKEFAAFLEENGMISNEKLSIDISKIYYETNYFTNILHCGYCKSDFINKSNYIIDSKPYNEKDGIGWYVADEENKPLAVFWFGVVPNEIKYKENVIFIIMNYAKVKISNVSQIDAESDLEENLILNKRLNMKKLIDSQNLEEQIELCTNWFNDIYSEIYPTHL